MEFQTAFIRKSTVRQQILGGIDLRQFMEEGLGVWGGYAAHLFGLKTASNIDEHLFTHYNGFDLIGYNATTEGAHAMIERFKSKIEKFNSGRRPVDFFKYEEPEIVVLNVFKCLQVCVNFKQHKRIMTLTIFNDIPHVVTNFVTLSGSGMNVLSIPALFFLAIYDLNYDDDLAESDGVMLRPYLIQKSKMSMYYKWLVTDASPEDGRPLILKIIKKFLPMFSTLTGTFLFARSTIIMKLIDLSGVPLTLIVDGRTVATNKLSALKETLDEGFLNHLGQHNVSFRTLDNLLFETIDSILNRRLLGWCMKSGGDAFRYYLGDIVHTADLDSKIFFTHTGSAIRSFIMALITSLVMMNDVLLTRMIQMPRIAIHAAEIGFVISSADQLAYPTSTRFMSVIDAKLSDAKDVESEYTEGVPLLSQDYKHRVNVTIMDVTFPGTLTSSPTDIAFMLEPKDISEMVQYQTLANGTPISSAAYLKHDVEVSVTNPTRIIQRTLVGKHDKDVARLTLMNSGPTPPTEETIHTLSAKPDGDFCRQYIGCVNTMFDEYLDALLAHISSVATPMPRINQELFRHFRGFFNDPNGVNDIIEDIIHNISGFTETIRTMGEHGKVYLSGDLRRRVLQSEEADFFGGRIKKQTVQKRTKKQIVQKRTKKTKQNGKRYHKGKKVLR